MQMIGQQFSHYTIKAKLGAGGMGEVYLADDHKLDRQVALKFLPETLSENREARARLIREAKAASKLNHPNIVTIHSVEETDGRDFIVMEYVDGRPLAPPDKVSDLQKSEHVLHLASQICDGLRRAHELGIIHRDLKPANILVDPDGRPRILDFGLAKIAGASKLTRTGSTVGTLAYTSPEQVHGQDADQRSDIFSLGTIMYELIAGQRPFDDDHEAALLYAILNEEPPPLPKADNEVAQGLQAVVTRCLAKEPERRYQSAADLLTDLRRLASGAQVATTARRTVRRKKQPLVIALAAVVLITLTVLSSWLYFKLQQDAPVAGHAMLAVLPLRNRGASEHEYFADGITEEINVRLAGISNLGLIASPSVMRYKNTEKSPTEIGQELGVDYILDGSIAWQHTDGTNDRVIVQPQLIRLSDGAMLWGQRFDEAMTELFTVQSEIARKIVAALNLTLVVPEEASLDHRPTDNLEAYDYYLQGNDYWSHIGGGIEAKPLRLAAQSYEMAVALDSGFAEAQAKLARVYTELYWHIEPLDSLLDLSHAAMRRALAIDATRPDIRLAKGSLHYHEGQYDSALTEFNLTLAADPGNAEALEEMGYLWRRRGDFEKTLEYQRQAALFNPQSGNLRFHIGNSLFLMRRYDDAEVELERARKMSPELAATYLNLGYLKVFREGDLTAARAILDHGLTVVDPTFDYHDLMSRLAMYQGDYETALAHAATELDGVPEARLMNTGTVYHVMGDDARANAYFDSARVVLEEGLAARDSTRITWLEYAIMLGHLGRLEDAAKALEKSEDAAESIGRWELKGYELFLRARVYIFLGQHDAAMAELEHLLSIPAFFAGQSLRLNPLLAPLREHPRFEELANM